MAPPQQTRPIGRHSSRRRPLALAVLFAVLALCLWPSDQRPAAPGAGAGRRLGVPGVPVVYAQAGPVRVNAGGALFVDGAGASWAADSGFVIGPGGTHLSNTYAVADAINGTTDDTLYQSERYSLTTLEWSTALSTGTYQVTLKFAEIFQDTVGARVFHVDLEGTRVLTDFDILAEVPKFTALDKQFVVSVSDGTLDVLFTTVADAGKVNAVQVLQLAGTPTPTPAPGTTNQTWTMGAYEDWGVTGSAGGAGNTAALETMVADLRAHNLDGAVFTNGFVPEQAGKLGALDALSFPHYISPMGELYAQVWHATPPPTLDSAGAHAIADPLVDQLSGFSSVRGYNLLDDATNPQTDQIQAMVRAFQERDPTRPAVVVAVESQNLVYADLADAGLVEAFLGYAYPYGPHEQACETTYPGFSEAGANTFDQSLRQMTRFVPEGAPRYFAVQAHGAGGFDLGQPDNGLREPTADEIRLEHGLALGERVDGIYWFNYSDVFEGDPPVRAVQGFSEADRTAIYAEIGAVTQRTRAFEAEYVATERAPREQFTVTASDQASLAWYATPYRSTLYNPTTGSYYVVVVNRACASKTLTVSSAGGFTGGQLVSLEPGGQTVQLGAAFTLAAGDWRVFRLANATGAALPVVQPASVLANGSFNTDAGGFPADWSPSVGGSRDTAVVAPGVATPPANTGALKMAGGGGGANGTSQQTILLQPNTRYAVSFWVKTESVDGPGVSVRYATTSPALVMRGSRKYAGTQDWTLIEEHFYTPPEVDAGVVQILWELAPGDVAYLDDLRLCPGESCEVAAAPPPAGVAPEVPDYPPAYGTGVEAWWSTHPYNPEYTQGYVPVGAIATPEPVIDVGAAPYSGSISAAFAACPAAGCTLYFPNGTYTLSLIVTARNNVAFVGESQAGVILETPNRDENLYVRACASMDNLVTFNAALHDYAVNGGDDAAAQCVTTLRPTNWYFRDLTFSGGTVSPEPMTCRGCRRFTFDRVTWRNFGTNTTPPIHPHPGGLTIHEWGDQIYFRRNYFTTDAGQPMPNNTHYWDGCHACGDLENLIDLAFQNAVGQDGGPDYKMNDDVTADINRNGLIDPNENRVSQYVVLYRNQFGPLGQLADEAALGTPVPFRGATVAATHVLFKENQFTTSTDSIGYFQGKCDAVNDRALYGTSVDTLFTDIVIDGNFSVGDVRYVFLDTGGADGVTLGQGYDCAATSNQNTYLFRDATLKHNQSLTSPGAMSTAVVPYMPQGVLPTVVRLDNCFNGTLWETGGPCTLDPTPTPYPTPGGAPSATPTPSPTPTPLPSGDSVGAATLAAQLVQSGTGPVTYTVASVSPGAPPGGFPSLERVTYDLTFASTGLLQPGACLEVFGGFSGGLGVCNTSLVAQSSRQVVLPCSRFAGVCAAWADGADSGRVRVRRPVDGAATSVRVQSLTVQLRPG